MKNRTILVVILIATSSLLAGCYEEAKSVSGTKMTTVGTVQKTSAGDTVEQSNIKRRIAQDNMPGAVKHLYVISPYSGQVIIYSTVKSKTSSSGKRLTPDRVDGSGYFRLPIAGSEAYYTQQLLGEDGTYGRSGDYIYWWDTKDVYHEHHMTGGQIIHISSEPLAVKSVIINMEISEKK